MWLALSLDYQPSLYQSGRHAFAAFGHVPLTVTIAVTAEALRSGTQLAVTITARVKDRAFMLDLLRGTTVIDRSKIKTRTTVSSFPAE